MGAIAGFVSECLTRALRRPSARIELGFAACCAAGLVAAKTAHLFSGAGPACLMGAIAAGGAFLFEGLIVVPFRHIDDLERTLLLQKPSPIEIEVIDRDLASNGSQCRCEVRVSNRGASILRDVKIEMADLEESMRNGHVNLPHELTQPGSGSPFARILGALEEEAPSTEIQPGKHIIRGGLISVLVAKPLVSDRAPKVDEKIICAFAGSGRLIEMSDVSVGRRYTFKIRASARDVPPKEVEFQMRVIDQSCPKFRVSFLRSGESTDRLRDPQAAAASRSGNAG